MLKKEIFHNDCIVGYCKYIKIFSVETLLEQYNLKLGIEIIKGIK